MDALSYLRHTVARRYADAQDCTQTHEAALAAVPMAVSTGKELAFAEVLALIDALEHKEDDDGITPDQSA